MLGAVQALVPPLYPTLLVAILLLHLLSHVIAFSQQLHTDVPYALGSFLFTRMNACSVVLTSEHAVHFRLPNEARSASGNSARIQAFALLVYGLSWYRTRHCVRLKNVQHPTSSPRDDSKRKAVPESKKHALSEPLHAWMVLSRQTVRDKKAVPVRVVGTCPAGRCTFAMVL